MVDLGGGLCRCLAGFRRKIHRSLLSASWELTVLQDVERTFLSRSRRSGIPSGERVQEAASRRFRPGCPWPSFLSRSSARPPSSIDAQLDDGSASRSKAPSVGVQWHRSALRAAGPVRYLQAQVFVDGRERRASRRAVTEEHDRTEQCDFRCRFGGQAEDPAIPASRRSRPSTCSPRDRAPAYAARPRNRRTLPRSASLKVAKDGNALVASLPFPKKAANVRNASAVSGERAEKDKPGLRRRHAAVSRHCAVRLEHSLFALQPEAKSAPGAAICRETADFDLEAARP